MSDINLSGVEKIKIASNGLRGTIKESLMDDYTGAIREDDQSLIKFHGMYQQDDRDRREERSTKKLEWLYSFMCRLRLPGGFLKPEQWVALHHVAGEHTTGVIKITTRQTIQLHGILKSHIKPTMQSFNTQALDSIATCGDVNRNVCCTSNPAESPVHEEVFQYSAKISQMAKPKTRAWYEIWLGEEKIGEKTEDDPLYQDRYLPRKLKVGITLPPNNDVDVLINDNIILRMTGCPNGCGRSPNAEIGFVGTSLGKYNLHIGCDRLGLRLNTKFKDSLNEEQILATLDDLFGTYVVERFSGETFGDFTYRKYIA